MARDFNGSTQYLNLGNNSYPSGSSERTIALWFNADSFAAFGSLISYSEDAGLGSVIDIYAEDDGISVAFNGHREIIQKNNLSTGVWYHFTLVIPNGATQTNETLYYLDGSLEAPATEAGSSQTLNTGTPNVLIGARQVVTPDRHFEGRLAEIAIWDRALDAQEISALGKGAIPALYPNGLLTYLPVFGRQSPEIDWFGGNDATLVNSPTYSDHPRVIHYQSAFTYIPGTAASPQVIDQYLTLLGVG